MSSGRQNTLHSNSLIRKEYENPPNKIVQSRCLCSRSRSIISIFYYCYYYYRTLGIFSSIWQKKKKVIMIFFLLAWEYPGVTQRIFYNEKLLRGIATFGRVKLWKQFSNSSKQNSWVTNIPQWGGKKKKDKNTTTLTPPQSVTYTWYRFRESTGFWQSVGPASLSLLTHSLKMRFLG